MDYQTFWMCAAYNPNSYIHWQELEKPYQKDIVDSIPPGSACEGWYRICNENLTPEQVLIENDLSKETKEFITFIRNLLDDPQNFPHLLTPKGKISKTKVRKYVMKKWDFKKLESEILEWLG